MTTMRIRLLTLPAIGLLAILGGCGGSQTPAATTAPAPTTTVTTTQPTPAAAVTELTVRVSKGVVTGDTTPTVALGRRVRLRVVADTADVAHVHGYDKEVDVSVNAPAVVTFTADIPGRFEVEFHHSGIRLMELTVK